MNALLLLVALLGFSPIAPLTTHQTLSFVLSADNAATQRLPHYRAAAPILVHVAADASRFNAVTVTATGPDGTAIRAPLARTIGGFDGALRLATPGQWTVALVTQMGSVSNSVAGVPLNVVAADGAEIVAYATAALAVLCTALGVLVLVRRDLVARFVVR